MSSAQVWLGQGTQFCHSLMIKCLPKMSFTSWEWFGLERDGNCGHAACSDQAETQPEVLQRNKWVATVYHCWKERLKQHLLRQWAPSSSHCHGTDICIHVQNSQIAGGEEQGTGLLSDSPSMLQHCLSSEVSNQAHDIIEGCNFLVIALQDYTMNYIIMKWSIVDTGQ